MLWTGNAIICSFMASFLAQDYMGGSYIEIADLFGAMASAMGILFGGLLVGHIATRIMQQPNDRNKNIVYFLGVLLFAGITIFNKIIK